MQLPGGQAAALEQRAGLVAVDGEARARSRGPGTCRPWPCRCPPWPGRRRCSASARRAQSRDQRARRAGRWPGTCASSSAWMARASSSMASADVVEVAGRASAAPRAQHAPDRPGEVDGRRAGAFEVLGRRLQAGRGSRRRRGRHWAASTMPYPAATPMAGAPRTARRRMASQTRLGVAAVEVLRLPGQAGLVEQSQAARAASPTHSTTFTGGAKRLITRTVIHHRPKVAAWAPRFNSRRL